MDLSSHPENTILLISAQASLAKKIRVIMSSAFQHLALNVISSGVEGLKQVYDSPPAVIVVDSTLADISGMHVCRILKHDPALRKLPIILITKDAAPDYQRFNELALVADVFIEEQHITQEFSNQLQMVLNLFQGLDKDERAQVRLLQQGAVRTEATSRLVQLLDQSITEMSLMKSFHRLFELVSKRNVMYHMLFSILETVMDYDIAAVFFNDKNREPRFVMFHSPGAYCIQDDQFKAWAEEMLTPYREQNQEPWLFDTIRHEVVSGTTGTPESQKPVSIKHTCVYPFYIENKLVGTLAFYNRKDINYEIIFPFDTVLQQLSVLMRLRYYYTEAQVLSLTDALTGLYNYQNFSAYLEREVRHSKRHKTPLTLAIISLDDLKAMNTQWGHALGDAALKTVAEVVLKSVRSIDVLGRSGGRSILCLFPQTTPEAAMVPIQRIQEALSESPLVVGDNKVTVSLSVGIAGYNDTIENGTVFLAEAQKAVEHAREKGHNHVELVQ